MTYLEECLKKSFSIESKDPDIAIEYLGYIQRGNKIYDVYIDENGDFWHNTMFETENGIISHYEHIFGHPEPAKYRRYYPREQAAIVNE